MEQVNIVIIGAGIVGLAVAKELSEIFDDVIVVDKEKTFGQHTSSRNSEVIHSGIYYPNNSLKARLSVHGNELLYKFCEQCAIPHKKTGKLVVANSNKEKQYINWLCKNGKRNGVTNLAILNHEQISELEPEIKADTALYVASTGIIDTHQCMKVLEKQVEKQDGFVIYDMDLVQIDYTKNNYILHFENGESIQSNWVVNSAGLFSDQIFSMLEPKEIHPELALHWCKGEYYKSSKKLSLEHLVYPVPDPDGIFLGIHATINLQNEVRFGPNAYYVNELSYQMDETYKSEFLKAINKYLCLKDDEIHLDDCGIRPKLQDKNDAFKDFYIQEEVDRGFPQFINLIGIESPGLTACLAIGKYVVSLLNGSIT